MDDDFYDWLMLAYENKELDLSEIENACKDRCGARKLWQEFTFENDEIDYAMGVIAHVWTGIKWQLAKDKEYNDLNTPPGDNTSDRIDHDSQPAAEEKE